MSLFAVAETSKALDFRLGAGRAIILGTMTAVGGGMVRDVLLWRMPVWWSTRTSGSPPRR